MTTLTKEIQEVLTMNGITFNGDVKTLFIELLSIDNKSEDINKVILTLSKDNGILGTPTHNGSLYKGNSIDLSGICHNIEADKVIIKSFSYISCNDLLAQSTALLEIPKSESESDNAYNARLSINKGIKEKCEKIALKNEDAVFIRVTYTYTSTTAKGKTVSKIFYDTTPFSDANGKILLEIGTEYKVLKTEISGIKGIGFGEDFYTKHQKVWGVKPTSNYNYLQIKSITKA